MSDYRSYRFVGGPRHQEYIGVAEATRVVLVPVARPLVVTWADDSPMTASSRPSYRAAVYEREGDYPDEWFYKFQRIEK